MCHPFPQTPAEALRKQLTHPPCPHAHPQSSEKHYQEPKFCDGWWDGEGNADLANSIGALLKVEDFRVRA